MFVQTGDLVIHAMVQGAATAPPILLLHSLGTNLHMWDPQAEALAAQYRVIRMDMRGHGLTEAPPGPYTMAVLARDALALLDSLGIAAAHCGGVSIGGHIALQVAARAPGRVLSLLPCDTALEFGGAANWTERMAAVAAGGLAAIADATMARWVCDRSLAASKGLRRMLLATDPAGWLGCAAALRDTDPADLLGRLACPATIIVGERDQSTPPAAAAAIQAAIPGSTLVTLAEAAHIPNFEQAPAMTRAVLAHMARVTALPAAALDAGMVMRRRILGDAHVDRAEAALTALDRPFRDFILEGVWGRVWTRPGLAVRDRSLLCLGILAALQHHDEFRLHVRATANTGVTPEEIAEVLLQVAAYGGVPAGNTALRIARDTLNEMPAQ